jgi:hypothetical protein
MVWSRRRRRKAGLTGSGRIIENIHLWFWDDRAYPGLITREKFDELQRLALSEAEQRKLSSALAGRGIVSRYVRESYFAKINEYLVEQGKKGSIDHWVGFSWDSRCFDVFKAYLNVLAYWGFDFAWKDIFDVRCDPAIVVLRGGQPVHCVLQDDIIEIVGRPCRFAAHTYRAAWSIDVTEPRLVVTSRLKREDYREGEPIVRKCVVGSRSMIVMTASEFDEAWPRISPEYTASPWPDGQLQPFQALPNGHQFADGTGPAHVTSS